MKLLRTIITERRWRRLLLGATIALACGIVLDQVVMPLVVHSRKTITMPNVIGMPVEQAVELLQRYGLHVQDIRQQYDSSQPAGRVVLQMPFPNTTVREGRRVYLVVSRGDELVRVPSLVGMSLRDAQLALLREGLQLGSISAMPCDSIGSSGIIAQSPAADALVRVGTAVAVTVCRDTAAQVEVPSVLYVTAAEAEQLLLQANLQVGEILHEHDETYMPGTVIRQEPPAGARVPPLTQVRLWVASN